MKLYTYSNELFSDLYKDVRGSRPTLQVYERWNSLNPDDKQKFWDDLKEELNFILGKERELELQSISEIEDEIKFLINCGAKNREAAVRFMMRSHDVIDLEHLCYVRNLPLQYFA